MKTTSTDINTLYTAEIGDQATYQEIVKSDSLTTF